MRLPEPKKRARLLIYDTPPKGGAAHHPSDPVLCMTCRHGGTGRISIAEAERRALTRVFHELGKAEFKR